MSNKIIKNNLGISILEVIVAMMIITLGLVGVLSLVIQNIQAQYINKNVLMASGLAQEGLELARNIRDLNWLIPGNTYSDIASGAYTMDYRGLANIRTVSSLDDPDARLYVDSNGFYTNTASGNTPTNFFRLIMVVNNTDYLDVQCAIRWKDGGQNHDYTAETYLYDWR